MNMESTALIHFKGVIDTTLREGLQFARAAFAAAQHRRIFDYLQQIGVDYIEVGNPVQDNIGQIVSGLARSRGPHGAKILCHVRNHPRDIARAIDCGADGVNILCTVDLERLDRMGLTLADYQDRVCRGVNQAREHGLEVRVGVEDFFGQDSETALDIYATAVACGAERIAVADTLGKTMPWEVMRRIRRLRNRFPVDIEVHFHNDLGHAVSNAIAALRAGANWVSTSLLGIGERTGITPLSSFLANLHVLDERAARRYRLSRLTEAENYVACVCGIDMPLHLMTNPASGFAHKAGIHLDALIKFGPHKYECLPPEVIGNKRRLVISTIVSGKTTEEDVAAFEERFGRGWA